MRTFACLFLVLLAALPARAQAPDASLPGMLAELKAAPTPEAATALAQQIAAAWLGEATPAVRLLLESGMRALDAHATAEATRDFAAAVTLQPDLAEAWSQRALAHFQAGDAAAAVDDLAHALTLDPDHFTALETLSYVAQSRDDWLGALAAWKKLLAVDPEISGGEQRLKMLERRALGQNT
ncbi:MAG: tetratricopeptide repeat protein [Acetobacteraceae bacterium]